MHGIRDTRKDKMHCETDGESKRERGREGERQRVRERGREGLKD